MSPQLLWSQELVLRTYFSLLFFPCTSQMAGLPADKRLHVALNTSEECPPAAEAFPRAVRCVEVMVLPDPADPALHEAQAELLGDALCSGPHAVDMAVAGRLRECSLSARRRVALAALSSIVGSDGLPRAVTLRLPRGTRYHPLAGELTAPQLVRIRGLGSQRLVPHFSLEGHRYLHFGTAHCGMDTKLGSVLGREGMGHLAQSFGGPTALGP